MNNTKKSIILLSLVSSLVISLLFTSCSENTKNESNNKGKNSPSQTAIAESPTPTVQPTPSGYQRVDKDGKRIKKKAKALYLTGWTVGSEAKVQYFVDLAKKSEVNSYVVDIKDDDGKVSYKSNVEIVNQVNGWAAKYDPKKVIEAFHKENIRVIGRLACFKDPIASSKKPELAIQSTNGGVWRDKDGRTWLDPYNKATWDFIISIAKEADELGFDEIQFDYIRFANDGDRKAMSFNTEGKQKFEIINEFLAYCKTKMPDVIIGADVFGIICESPADTEGIGQNLEYIGKDIDYICPMVYPSHYAVNQIVNKVQFPKPDLEPYGVVKNTMIKCMDRILKVPDYKAKVRPYLQDFNATWLGKGYYQEYGDAQLKDQIRAVTEAGIDEWIVWDPLNTYHEGAFGPDDGSESGAIVETTKPKESATSSIQPTATK